jgi:hypothetical protein
MRLRIVVPALVAAVGLFIAVGCGGGGGHSGGGSSSSGNASVDATLTQLETSMRSGSTNIDGTITVGVIANPLVAPVSTSGTATLGGRVNDGTATNVSVAYIVSFNTTTGSFNESETVDETSSNFQFLSFSGNVAAPNFSIRPAALAAAALNSTTQTGQYFAILTVSQTENVTRLFTNTSPTTMATLVNFGTITAIPVANLSGTLTSSQDYLLGYAISGTPPVAKLNSIVRGSGTSLSTRNLGPQLQQIGLAFTNVSFAGVGVNPQKDVTIPIANDAPNGIAPNSVVDIAGSTAGGFGVATVQTTSVIVSGPLANTPFLFNTTSFSVATSLAGLNFVNNGTIDTGQPVRVDALTIEDPLLGQTLRHTLDASLPTGTMKATLYFPEASTREVTFYIFQ